MSDRFKQHYIQTYISVSYLYDMSMYALGISVYAYYIYIYMIMYIYICMYMQIYAYRIPGTGLEPHTHVPYNHHKIESTVP